MPTPLPPVCDPPTATPAEGVEPRILDLWRSGACPNEIVEELHVSRGTLREVLLKNGLIIYGRDCHSKRLPAALVAQLVEEGNGKKRTAAGIARHLGLDVNTVRAVLHRNGITMNQRSVPVETPETLGLCDAIAKDFSNGISVRDLGIKYNVATSTVYTALKRAGVVASRMRVTHEDRALFKQMSSEGFPLSVIGRETGFSAVCVRTHLLAMGVNTKKKLREGWRGHRIPLYNRRENGALSKPVAHVTADQYFAMAAAQDNRCAICGCLQTNARNCKASRLVVDHCHRRIRVRGLLCRKCSILIRFSDDFPGILEKAAAYLSRTATPAK